MITVSAMNTCSELTYSFSFSLSLPCFVHLMSVCVCFFLFSTGTGGLLDDRFIWCIFGCSAYTYMKIIINLVYGIRCMVCSVFSVLLRSLFQQFEFISIVFATATSIFVAIFQHDLNDCVTIDGIKNCVLCRVIKKIYWNFYLQPKERSARTKSQSIILGKLKAIVPFNVYVCFLNSHINPVTIRWCAILCFVCILCMATWNVLQLFIYDFLILF